MPTPEEQFKRLSMNESASAQSQVVSTAVDLSPSRGTLLTNTSQNLSHNGSAVSHESINVSLISEQQHQHQQQQQQPNEPVSFQQHVTLPSQIGSTTDVDTASVAVDTNGVHAEDDENDDGIHDKVT